MGKPILVSVNAYQVEKFPTATIWQYDVSETPSLSSVACKKVSVASQTAFVAVIHRSISYMYQVIVGKGDAEKPGTVKAVWNSKILQSQIGPNWIFDGKRLAW